MSTQSAAPAATPVAVEKARRVAKTRRHRLEENPPPPNARFPSIKSKPNIPALKGGFGLGSSEPTRAIPRSRGSSFASFASSGRCLLTKFAFAIRSISALLSRRRPRGAEQATRSQREARRQQIRAHGARERIACYPDT